MKHICRECGQQKDVTEFRKNYRDGPYEPWNLRKCKECVHSEYLERYSSKEKREALKKSSKNWKVKNKKRHAEINNRWYHANKDKARAGAKLRYAIQKGRIDKKPCEVCGKVDKVQGHHDSYEAGSELDVRWLCQEHHKCWHIILDQISTKDNLDIRFISFVKSMKD